MFYLVSTRTSLLASMMIIIIVRTIFKITRIIKEYRRNNSSDLSQGHKHTPHLGSMSSLSVIGTDLSRSCQILFMIVLSSILITTNNGTQKLFRDQSERSESVVSRLLSDSHERCKYSWYKWVFHSTWVLIITAPPCEHFSLVLCSSTLNTTGCLTQGVTMTRMLGY